MSPSRHTEAGFGRPARVSSSRLSNTTAMLLAVGCLSICLIVAIMVLSAKVAAAVLIAG